MQAAFRCLKDHATERGIEFTIDIVTFTIFALHTRYLNRTGLKGDCLTVDRIDNRLGYLPGNIQAMTRAKNSEKRWKYDAIRMERGLARAR